jgi:archaellum component FlaC
MENDIKGLEHDIAELKKEHQALERRINIIERSAGGSVYELERRMRIVEDLEKRVKALEVDLETAKREFKSGQDLSMPGMR